MSERLRLGDMLVAAKLVTEAQVREALSTQRETGRRLGETLVDLGYVTEPQMTQVLSNQLSIPWVDLHHVDFSRELLDLVPAEIAEQHGVVPVYVRHVRRQGDTLYVAMDDPMNVDALQEVADFSGLPTKPMVASPTDIRDAVRVYYLGLPRLDEVEEEEDEGEVQVIYADVSEPPPPRSTPPEDAGPGAQPSMPPPERTDAPVFRTLTLLDGTVVRLPGASSAKPAASPRARGLTTRDLIHALRARAAGEDVSDVLPDGAWEPLFATLLSVLLEKGLVADWEFVDEWKKQTRTIDE